MGKITCHSHALLLKLNMDLDISCGALIDLQLYFYVLDRLDSSYFVCWMDTMPFSIFMGYSSRCCCSTSPPICMERT